jgi:hypothetical protein
MVSFVRFTGPVQMLVAALLIASGSADAKGDAPHSNPAVELTAQIREVDDLKSVLSLSPKVTL